MQFTYSFCETGALNGGRFYRGPVMIPWPHLLKGIRGLEYQVIPVPGSDYLKAHGQIIFSETCRHGGGGMTGEVKGIGKGHCSEQRDGVPIDIPRWRALCGKCFSGHCGSEEEVKPVKEVSHDSVQFGSDFLSLKVVFNRKGMRSLQYRQKGGHHCH